jgi:uncharacterized protein (TIGR03086 family)
MTQTTTPDDLLALLDQRADRFTRVVDAVDGAWDAPSPCEGWSARDVVGHVVETQRAFLGQHGIDTGPAPDLTDPAAAWRTHRDHLSSALRADGVAAREYDGYFGRTTIGATAAEFYGWDLVIHGGDVARATGQAWSVTDAEAEELLAGTEAWGDALYSEGVCGPAIEVPEDASPTDRLLARLGRDPRWEPSVS